MEHRVVVVQLQVAVEVPGVPAILGAIQRDDTLTRIHWTAPRLERPRRPQSEYGTDRLPDAVSDGGGCAHPPGPQAAVPQWVEYSRSSALLGDSNSRVG